MTTTGRVVERLVVGHRALHKARKCFGNLDRGKRWLISKQPMLKWSKLPFNVLIQQMLNKQFKKKKFLQSVPSSGLHFLLSHFIFIFIVQSRNYEFELWVCLGRWRHHWNCWRGHAQHDHLWLKESEEPVQLKETGEYYGCSGEISNSKI